MTEKKGYLKWLVGFGIIAIAIGIGTQLNLGDGVVYFYVPGEVKAQAAELQGKTIKVGAMVKEGSVVWKPKDLTLDFVITDFNGSEFKVEHKGVKPDMFKENQGVVVEGKLKDSDTIASKTLMVKHSEEYKKPDEGHGLDKELLKESIFK